MLIHLVPQFYCNGPCGSVSVIDLEIPELGLLLKNGIDITARTPYPNKNYFVVSRKVGKKAILGLFVETGNPIQEFNCIVRWSIAGDLQTHKVHYILDDQTYDATSDDMISWYGYQGEDEEWPSRWPECHKSAVPVKRKPRMDLYPEDPHSLVRDGQFTDIIDPNTHQLLERSETFIIPTIERERLLGKRAKEDRYPNLEDAFKI